MLLRRCKLRRAVGAAAATAAGGYFMDIDCSDDARKYPSVQYSVLRAFIEFRSI